MADTHTEVLMPLMGEGIVEATLVRWLKKPGEKVEKDEPLLEVSTDKVDTEIPAPASGTLISTFANDGETIAVNAVIAHIGAAGAAASAGGSVQTVATRPAAPVTAPAPAVKSAASPSEPSGPAAAPALRVQSQPAPARPAMPAPAAAVAAQAPTPVTTGSIGLRSSPLVRKMAKAGNIDLSQVQGTGMLGRITRRDVENYLASPPPQSHGVAQVPPAPAVQAPASPNAAAAGPRNGQSHLDYGRVETRMIGDRETLEGVPVRRERMSKMRSLIAEHMVRSVRTSPHVTTIFEIDMHRVTTLREKLKNEFRLREGFNLTFTAFFAWAATQAIKRHPIVNVSVDGDDILWKDDINIGVAVALETGLIVPVIRNAGELNFTGIARRLNDLVVRARSKKLLPEDVQGGTFSITNPGMFGSIVSSPIISQPQVAILSIGAVVKRPVVIDDMIGVRPLCQIGLTFDHRVVDGEGGARYLASLKEILENFDEPVF